MPIMAYQEIIERTLAADTGNAARLVIAAPYVWQHLPFLHYLSADRTFYMMRDELPDSFTRLIPPERIACQSDQALQAHFSQFIDQTAEIWLYNQRLTGKWVSEFVTAALSNYDEKARTQRSWYGAVTPAYGDSRKFVRVPDDLSKLFIFDDQVWLQVWLLKQRVNVTPCQQITVQSWWSADQRISNNLSMTLVLMNATDSQGIANYDGLLTGRDSGDLILEPPHVDERSIQIPCNIQPGEYPLLIGVYALTGDKINPLPVSLSNGTPLGNFAYLTTLFVQP